MATTVRRANNRSGPEEKPRPPASAVVAPIEDAYLPLRALVVYSGLSIRTLNKKFADPTHPLPFFKFGGKIHVRKWDFDVGRAVSPHARRGEHDRARG